MKHPLLALAWHSWRLSRRWYFFVLGAILALSHVLFNVLPAGFDARMLPPGVTFQHFSAMPLILVVFSLATISTQLAVSIGNKHGFPFSFEYRLPVSSFALTAVPMLCLALLCASLYAIPMGLYRVLNDLPYPILPPVVLISFSVCVLAACSWCTTSYAMRAMMLPVAVTLLVVLFAWFKPVDPSFDVLRAGKPPDLAAVIALTNFQYVLILGLGGLLLALTARDVATLRSGGRSTTGTARSKGLLSWPGLVPNTWFEGGPLATMDRLFETLALHCPTRRAWHAECWVEFRRYGFPILLLSLVGAVLIPLLLWLGLVLHWPGVQEVTNSALLILYFVGIGMALFNRRASQGGLMNAFEGARAMSTAQLASIQMLMTAAAIALGSALLRLSLQLSSPLATALAARTREAVFDPYSLVEPLTDAGLSAVVGNQLMELVLFVAVIALYSCLHSCSVIWGRKFFYGVVLAIFYCFIFMFRIRSGRSDPQTIINHMWAVGAGVVLLSLFLGWRLLKLQIIRHKALVVLLVLWLLHAGCSYIALQAHGYAFDQMPSELLMFNFALVLLPLTVAFGTLWCYDRLRHG